MVFKEQLEDLREQTRMIIHEPKYDPLRRFLTPFGLRREPSRIKLDLLISSSERTSSLMHRQSVMRLQNVLQ